jgi:hypothetical protein
MNAVKFSKTTSRVSVELKIRVDPDDEDKAAVRNFIF